MINLKIVYDAIRQAVKNNGQNDFVAEALIAWFRELGNGNESIGDIERVKQRLDLLLEKTEVNDEQLKMTSM